MNQEWIGCATHNFRPGRPAGFRPELIVIHVIVGSLLSADRWFNNPDASVSAHYGVGCDGRIHQYVAEIDTAFHAGIIVNPACKLVQAQPNVNPNYYSIGIEHEGQPDDAWTTEQAIASAALIAEIAQRWNISIDDEHVVPHHSIRASKTCPGNQKKLDVLITAARTAAAQGLLVPSSLETVPVLNVPVARPQAAPASEVPVADAQSPQPQAVSMVSPPASPTRPAAADQVEIHVATNVRVRKGAPSTAAPVVNVLQAHTLFRPAAAVLGENVQGNPAWYRDADGNFIWAGGTDAPNPKL